MVLDNSHITLSRINSADWVWEKQVYVYPPEKFRKCKSLNSSRPNIWPLLNKRVLFWLNLKAAKSWCRVLNVFQISQWVTSVVTGNSSQGWFLCFMALTNGALSNHYAYNQIIWQHFFLISRLFSGHCSRSRFRCFLITNNSMQSPDGRQEVNSSDGSDRRKSVLHYY